MRAFIVDLAIEERAATDLSAGGVFIPNATVDLDDQCHIVLRAGLEDVTVVARAVQITETGAGFQIEGMTGALRARLVALVELAKHVDLEREKTRSLASIGPVRRAAQGSISPSNRRGSERRTADGSISPIVAFAPTQRDDMLSDQARVARPVPDGDPGDNTDE